MKTLKNILIFIILFITFIISDLFYIIPLSLMNINYDTLSDSMKLTLSIISSLCLMIIFIIIYRKYLLDKIKDFKKNISSYFDTGIQAWFIGLMGMAITNFLIAFFTPIKVANNEALVKEMISSAPFLAAINVVITAPFLEEMLFRKCFGDIFKNKKLMIFMSGLMFGLVHVIFSLETPLDFLYIVPYGFLGSSFAYILYKTDNVFANIMFHMIHNGILVGIAILRVILL